MWYVTTQIYQNKLGEERPQNRIRISCLEPLNCWPFRWPGRLALGPSLGSPWAASSLLQALLSLFVKWEDATYDWGLLWELMRWKNAQPWHLVSLQKSKSFCCFGFLSRIRLDLAPLGTPFMGCVPEVTSQCQDCLFPTLVKDEHCQWENQGLGRACDLLKVTQVLGLGQTPGPRTPYAVVSHCALWLSPWYPEAKVEGGWG